MASKPPVSVFILSRNEEQKIGPALESVSWAAEIVVIDSFSSDRTVDIATGHGARVVQIEFRRFGELRQAGIEHTTQPMPNPCAKRVSLFISGDRIRGFVH